MKKNCFYLILLLMTLASGNSFSQKLYDDLNPLAETKGKRFTVSSTANPMYPGDFMSYMYQDSSTHDFSANLYADFRKWKFTEKLLLAGYASGQFEYMNMKTNEFNLNKKLNSTRAAMQLYGGASYYLQPNKFFVTGALGLGLERYKISVEFNGAPEPLAPQIDTTVAPSYLWGALGYGRINNRKVVEVSYDFDEALRRSGIIKEKLNDKTLLKLSELLYRQADGEYQDKYEDAQMKELFRDIESTLLNAGYISGSLDAASTVELYEILNNTSKKYVFYPKYSGYQVQGQMQYELTNNSKTKTHDHYLTVSGVYCLNLSKQTNIILSGFFAKPLDTLASGDAPRSGYLNSFQNYLAFLPDRSNLDFFKPFPLRTGLGVYGGQYVRALATYVGLQADVYHSISSVVGVQGSISLINKKYSNFSPFVGYSISGKLDYNILNSLQASAKCEYAREAYDTYQTPAQFTVSFGFMYRVF